jgi:zinc protease
MKRWSLLFAHLAVLASLASPAGAQDKKVDEAPYQKGSTIEGITEYRFKNGLKFLSFPDPSSSTVTVNMTILVGSRHEGYGETGMAHLLEHMLFKGSKNYPDCDKAMQAHGADFNGTTWTDRTNYYETMPASDASLEFGIKLEADRLVNCFIKREDLVKEMTVVRNEFEMGENNPESILNQRMMAVAYEWHNYGKSTIGNRADIENVPIDRLQAFYKKYYQVDNTVLIIAGKFDEAKALKLISDTFGQLKAPARKLDQTYTEEPAQDGERSVLLRRVGKVAVVGAMYHIPAASDDDHPAIEVLSSILGASPSGRLYKALVESKKATKVSADATTWFDPGILELTLVVNDKAKAEEVRDIALEVTEEFVKRPATKDEVERAVRKYLSQREQALTKSQSIALELSEWVGAGDWRLLFIHRDRVAKVTPEDVNKVAEKYLRSSNRTVGMFLPSKEVARTPIPLRPDVTAIVKDYKGKAALSAGEVFDPTPDNIEKRVVRTKLSNGIQVAFLPKKTRGEAVVGSIKLHFGNEESLKDTSTASGMLGSMLMRGTKNYTRQQIQDELDKIKSTLNTGSGLGSLSVGLQSKREQLPKLLELAREVLREPTFPADELEVIKQNSKQAIEKAMADPQGVASNTFGRMLHPYPKDDVRYRPTFDESLDRLKKVDREALVKLYQEQVGPAVGEIVLVGDFDQEATLKQLETIFAGWNSKVKYQRIASDANTKVKGTRETLNLPDKENAVYVAGHLIQMDDTAADYPALELGNYILGNGFTSRLMDRLRQKEGWCYGAGSQLNVSSQDKYGLFLSYAICNPANADKVDKGALEEINKLVKDGVSLDELEAARKGYLEEMKVERGSDAKLAGMLRELLYLKRDFRYYSDLEKKIGGLSSTDVNRAISTHVQPDRMVIIRAGDFSKKK